MTATSLRPLRFLGVLAILVPLVAYAGFGVYRYQQLRAEADVRLRRILSIAHEHALKVFDSVESIHQRVLDVVQRQDFDPGRTGEANLNGLLSSIVQSKPQFQSIWIFDAAGKPLASSRFFPVPVLNVSDREYFRFHRESAAAGALLYVSKPLSARTTGDGIVDFSRPIVREGAFRGIVSISLFTQYFHRFHTELVADEPGLAINLFHESGEIYARTPTLPNAPDRLSDDSPVVARIRAGQRAAEIRGVSSVDQRDRLIAFRKIDGYPIYVGTGIDVADIRQELWNELARVLVFGIPLVVALYFTARLALRRTNETLQASERLRQEMQNRQRTETALQHSQKLEALGRLTGGVAHDFNNALMVISNNLFILSRKHPEVGTAQVQSISRAITSATKLTRQLLAFSRVQALVPEVVNLQDRLSSVKDMLSPVLGGQVTLTIDVAADTPAIFVDAAELELALVNLAINSRDAMPRGGAFTLNARLKTTDLPPLLSRPMVAIEAIDTGTGIESTILPKVFEPFFTTKEVGQGTGLGLSQIYGLCQRAGGTATVTSTVGAGTTVTLYFPAYGDAGPPAPTLKSQKPLHLSKQVLLVEDNEEVASALAPLLEAIGCRVHTLCNAPDALVWLHEKRPLPDVLLSDIVMPGEFDGLTLARHVRAAFPAIGIVLMTGYFAGMPEIERQGFEVLPKPCTADMLAEAIQRVAVNSSS